MLKPSLWNIDQAAVGSDWEWFWAHAVGVHFFAGECIFDFSPSRYVATNVGATFDGRGAAFAGSDRIEIPAATANAIADECTLVAVITHDGTTGSGHIFDDRASSGNGFDFDIYNAASGVNFSVDTGPLVLTTVPLGAAGRGVYVGRYDGSTASIDNHLGDNSSTAQTGSATPSTTAKIGNQANNGDDLGPGRYLEAFYLLDAAMSDALVRQIILDPFGPVRPADFVPFFHTAVAPTGVIMNQLQGPNMGADLYNGTIQ